MKAKYLDSPDLQTKKIDAIKPGEWFLYYDDLYLKLDNRYWAFALKENRIEDFENRKITSLVLMDVEVNIIGHKKGINITDLKDGKFFKCNGTVYLKLDNNRLLDVELETVFPTNEILSNNEAIEPVKIEFGIYDETEQPTYKRY